MEKFVLCKYYKINSDIYGKSEYFPTPAPKPRHKKYKLIRQGHENGKRTYKVRKVNTYDKILDDVQWFDLHSQINKDIAVTERVCLSNVTDQYNPDYEMMKEISTELALELKLKCRPLEDIFNIDAMKEYIMTRKGYTSKQKAQICDVADDMQIIDWLTLVREQWDQLYFDDEGELHMKGLQNPIAKRARFRAFIKDESYPESKRPRNITGASDYDKFIFGVVYGEIGHAFFSKPETIKMTRYDLRPKVISERLGPAEFVYVLDHTAFESAATADIQKVCEQNIYKIIYPDFEPFAMKYCEPLIFACGRNDPSLYVVDTSRASGAPNTSLGNSINNYVFIKMIEKQYNTEFKFLVEGDDCVINSRDELDVDSVKSFALRNGFDLKMEQCEHYCTSGFLSMQWSMDNFVVDSVEIWKHLMDAITFDPDKVLIKNRMDDRLYWKYQCSKFLSMALLNPKHELIHMLFEYSYKWYEYYFGKKKIKFLDRRKEQMLKFDTRVESSDLITKVRNTYHPELYTEIRSTFNYNQKDVDTVKKYLQGMNELGFSHAVNYILQIYHNRETMFYTNYECCY